MNGVEMIFGAPGCGKTTRLLGILTDLLKTVPPERIAYVSFTRKGTYEGVSRAISHCGLTEKQLPYFRTLHSIAFKAGEYSKYDMISRKNYREFSDAMGLRLTGYYTEDFFSNDDRYLFMYFLRRNNPRSAELVDNTLNTRVLQDVATNFERYKTYAKVHDFTDLIERFIMVGEPLPVDVAIIDEAQDLTTLQWKMCEVAFANCSKVYVAGDDDQAIYEWSGADVNYFLDLKRSSEEILGQSHRLPASVMNAAKVVSGQISRRVDKDFRASDKPGSVQVYNDIKELPEIKKGETWYFLARNSCFLAQFRQLLRQRAVLFLDKGEPSFDKREIEAIRMFEAGRQRGHLTDQEVIRLKPMMVENTDISLPWFNNLDIENDRMAYYRDLFKAKSTFTGEGDVLLSTIHGVKGGEADNVVIALDFTKAVRENMLRNPDAELRCLYVAMTRAKGKVHLVHTSTANGYDQYIDLSKVLAAAQGEV